MENGRLYNFLEECGYHLRFLKTKGKNYVFNLYLDTGHGFGEYIIPRCDSCSDNTDLHLWIQAQFKRLYPELFGSVK